MCLSMQYEATYAYNTKQECCDNMYDKTTLHTLASVLDSRISY